MAIFQLYLRKCLRSWLALFLLLVFAGPSSGHEWYYLIVFGSETTPKQPRYSHTWATFVKVTGPYAGPDPYRLETLTISWYPASLEIKPWRLLPECGTNVDLAATFRVAYEHKEQVSQFGPYLIDKELYERAVNRLAQLRSGQLQYKAIDLGYRPDIAVNCIHALGDIVWEDRLIHVGPLNFGTQASLRVTQHFAPWILDKERPHDWVANRLGLGCYPIQHLDLEGCLRN